MSNRRGQSRNATQEEGESCQAPQETRTPGRACFSSDRSSGVRRGCLRGSRSLLLCSQSRGLPPIIHVLAVGRTPVQVPKDEVRA